MSATDASTPPCNVPRAFVCFSCTRMPMTSDAPEPALYSGPIVSRNGLVRKIGANPAGVSRVAH